MKINDVFPLKAQYNLDEPISLNVLLENDAKIKNKYVSVEIYHLSKKIYESHKIIENENKITFNIPLNKTKKNVQGYGANVKLYIDGQVRDSLTTAFDRAKSWKYAPRYGFISDFTKKDGEDQEDIKEMNKLHLNVVQFYDWMYRHHEFFPEKDEFKDPLLRNLSMKTVKNKIEFCHKYSMKAFAYAAVYGAEKEFFLKHKGMALYNEDGVPMEFAAFIYFMDINRKNPWHDHIINELLKAVDFGFDGFHLDQYGFPKRAFSSSKKVRNLEDDFYTFINDVKSSMIKNHPDAGIIFNAVNNWPTNRVSKSKEDTVYIEVWDPNTDYDDLYNLISNAKRYAPQKQVILAAYMKAFKKDENIDEIHAENSALMTMAVIFASGGFHLLLGENKGVLTEGYYPDYAVVSSKFQRKLRDYYDFITRYEEILSDPKLEDISMTYTGGINGEFKFSGGNFSPKIKRNSIWTLIKQNKNFRIINLVNFTGIENMKWNNADKEHPEKVSNIEVTALIVNRVKGIYIASPDFNFGNSMKLDYKYVKNGDCKSIRFTIPKLDLWDTIYIEV